jgi:hypothetical protein
MVFFSQFTQATDIRSFHAPVFRLPLVIIRKASTNTQTSDTANTRFIKECYKIYLKREADATGLAHWVSDTTTTYGDPADAYGVLHLIDAFINSPEYRQRFGGS